MLKKISRERGKLKIPSFFSLPPFFSLLFLFLFFLMEKPLFRQLPRLFQLINSRVRRRGGY